MTTVFIVLWAWMLALTLFFAYRNNYTHDRLKEACHAVYEYNLFLLYMGKWNDASLDSYDKMLMGYNEHLFSIALWGRYSGIRPEYRELMKPYFDMEVDTHR